MNYLCCVAVLAPGSHEQKVFLERLAPQNREWGCSCGFILREKRQLKPLGCLAYSGRYWFIALWNNPLICPQTCHVDALDACASASAHSPYLPICSMLDICCKSIVEGLIQQVLQHKIQNRLCQVIDGVRWTRSSQSITLLQRSGGVFIPWATRVRTTKALAKI